jgi:hypothetical protein
MDKALYRSVLGYSSYHEVTMDKALHVSSTLLRTEAHVTRGDVPV